MTSRKGMTLSHQNTAAAAVLCALVLGVAVTPVASAQISFKAAATDAPVGAATALSATGLLTVAPLASLDGRNGFEQTSVASVALPDPTAPVLSLGALNAEVDAGRARASVVDLRTGPGLVRLPVDLTAQVIEATCVNGEGGVTLAGAKLGGTALDLRPGPDTGVHAAGLASVTLNEQRHNDDGSLTVVAVAIEVTGLQRIEIASATCAKGVAQPVPTTSRTPSAAPTTTSPAAGPADPGRAAPGKAPRPTPVEGHLAVTG